MSEGHARPDCPQREPVLAKSGIRVTKCWGATVESTACLHVTGAVHQRQRADDDRRLPWRAGCGGGAAARGNRECDAGGVQALGGAGARPCLHAFLCCCWQELACTAGLPLSWATLALVPELSVLAAACILQP